MGLFEQFLGKLRFSIEKTDFMLEVLNLEEAGEMMSISESEDKERFGKMIEFLKKIMKKNYPEESDESTEKFVVKYNNVLFEEIMIGMGWTTREKMEKVAKEAEEKSLEDSKKKI